MSDNSFEEILSEYEADESCDEEFAFEIRKKMEQMSTQLDAEKQKMVVYSTVERMLRLSAKAKMPISYHMINQSMDSLERAIERHPDIASIGFQGVFDAIREEIRMLTRLRHEQNQVLDNAARMKGVLNQYRGMVDQETLKQIIRSSKNFDAAVATLRKHAPQEEVLPDMPEAPVPDRLWGRNPDPAMRLQAVRRDVRANYMAEEQIPRPRIPVLDELMRENDDE